MPLPSVIGMATTQLSQQLMSVNPLTVTPVPVQERRTLAGAVSQAFSNCAGWGQAAFSEDESEVEQAEDRECTAAASCEI